MNRPGNMIKGILHNEEVDKRILYAVAYNGPTQPVIREVIEDLQRQLETLREQGIE